MTVTVISVTSQHASENYRQRVSNGVNSLTVDISPEEDGVGQEPTPFELLYGAWGACTNMTLQVYARRKGWPLERVETVIQATKTESDIQVEKRIMVWGALSEQQLVQLKLVAEKCPVNRLITRQRMNLQVNSSIQLKPI